MKSSFFFIFLYSNSMKPKLLQIPVIGIIISLLFFSCVGIRRIQLHLEKSSCAPNDKIQYSVEDIPNPFFSAGTDTALTTRFSFASLNVAHAIGIMDLLQEYVEYLQNHRQTNSIENRLRMLELAHQITQRIDLASLEVSSVTSELDCEEEKISQVADYLKAIEIKRESGLTVAAIVAGASSAILTGVLLSNGNSGDDTEYIGITSGITEATLGLLILLNNPKINFDHPGNVLREIWEGRKTSETFPPFIWYYLNYRDPVNPDSRSLRSQIIDRWMSFKQIKKAGSKKKQQLLELYFTDGGRYSTEQLYNRANMYDQLESYIKLIKQDLTVLAVEFQSLK